jgi:hypothetical protein
MIRVIIICLLGLALLIPLANAEEKPLSFLSCRSGDITILSASKELTVLSFELKGIDQGIDGDTTFENFTHRCMGIQRIKGGEVWSLGNCKYMDPDGDYFLVEWDGISGGKPLPWEFVQGTGKWKGIKGSGTAQGITKGKPIVEGTFQFCSKILGTYELPQ